MITLVHAYNYTSLGRELVGYIIVNVYINFKEKSCINQIRGNILNVHACKRYV